MTPEARALAALSAMGRAPQLEPLSTGSAPLWRAGDLILKCWTDSARAERQIARQIAVACRMRTGPFRAVPVIHHDGPLMVMPHIDGADLATLYGASANPDLAFQAGAWLRAFHGPGSRNQPFRPKGHANWLDRLIDAGESGTRHIPDVRRFVKVARGLQVMALDVRGKPSRKAVTHRDMTLSNLLYDGETLWGIDFENDREDEPLRDVFTLALDLMTLAPDDARGEAAVAALCEGYGDRHSAPPVRLFLMRCFCLWVWANTPAAPSLRQRERFRIAQLLLARDTALI